MIKNIDPTVFYISSHGAAGDHWYYWLAKALDAHPEIMIHIAEAGRQKYLNERSRKDRPDLAHFSNWLIDAGAPFTAIGDCWTYRSYQLEQLSDIYGDEIRFLNIVRHPYCWLASYTYWRCINMNMPPDNISGVEWEWKVTNHNKIKAYNLRPYTREEPHIWAAYQGMIILNRMISDLRPGVKNVRLEQMIDGKDHFIKAVDYLTHGRITYDESLLDLIYSWVDTPFRQWAVIRDNPEKEYAGWDDWKKEAFGKIVRAETLDLFKKHGYFLNP